MKRPSKESRKYADETVAQWEQESRIEAQHHSVTQKREKGRFVKQRTNGANKIDPASTVGTPLTYGLNRILRPQAAFRWILPNLAAITPQYIEMILRGALAGNHVQQWELFDLMFDTWPELAACQQELTYGVLRKKLVYEAYHEEDEKPTPEAIDRSKLVSCALRMMKPQPERDDAALDGTIKDLLDGWFRGVTVSEVIWQTVEDKTLGTIAGPKSTFWVHPVCFAFNADGVLGLRGDNKPMSNVQWPFPSSTLSAQPQPAQLVPFPDYKFLIAIHKAKSGTALGGPLLRPLAWWWCAANFSADWLLNLAQVFGLPFRWATYDINAPQATIDTICNMLQNMGSAGYAAFPTGTTLEMLNSGERGSDHSPQGELLDRADRYARMLILGQTMSGTRGQTGKGGGQAFGVVEKDVKEDRIDAAGKFVAGVINQQLVEYILMLNYGDTEEAPTIRFLEEEEAGLVEAQRDQALAKMGLEIGVDFLRKKYGIPEPADGEETIGGAPEPMPGGGFGDQQQGASGQAGDYQGAQDQNVNEDAATGKAISASGDKAGHEFRGNQYTGGKPDYSNWEDKKQLMMTAGGSHRLMQRQRDALEREGIPMRDVGAATLGSKKRTLLIPYHPHAAFHAQKSGMTISREQWTYLTKDLDAGTELPGYDELKTSDITMRQPSELQISVVDNHIIRDYMARIEKGDLIAPVVLRASGTIKDGNHRAAAYKKLGLQVPTVMMAGDKPGHAFHGNQYAIGDAVNTPHGTGIIISNMQNHAWVSTRNGGVQLVKHSDMSKIEKKTPFPGIAQSDENKRRLLQNQGIQTKLEELNAIEDDAVFAKELKKLAGIPDEPKPEPAPQVINVHVEAAKVIPTHNTFTINRADGTVVTGEVEKD